MITSKHLSVLTLALLWALPSCADHSSVLPTVESQNPTPPQAPTNPDDETLVATPPPSEPPLGSGGGGSGGGSGGGGSGGGFGGGGGSGGGGGGEPVSEPATMLLVGSGLQDMAVCRRRREKCDER